ncbi:hypothetical protein [Flagellimonas zhangzhouensis]|uniref:Toxin ETX/toxin MTX2 n=1 Tax=Flagellimonas zhangzhouensis TaxID=1073328 RepID=A0A1H2Y0P0_9FLAO|nr:hypothetical protein [Allomuricauda zhangzhouensis]SDQ94146.1 hypothetical protein SAMN05216294_2933 [Allomuricauda zhangzhouensis]SDW98773.1 hypothetical protein SAMN04487892_2925 [Allomuricauda zhangzhouensis]
MKSIRKSCEKVLLWTFLLLAFSCSKEENPDLGEVDVLPPEIPLEEFETDAGEIGISISGREIAKKGYTPFSALLNFENTNAINDTVISFDALNNLANLTLKNEQLNSDRESELKEGVAVEVTILDEDANVLASQNFTKLSFASSPSERPINADQLDDLFASVSLREDLKYYMQIVNNNNSVFGVPSSQNYTNTSNLATTVVFREDLDYSQNAAFSMENNTTYFFKKIPGNEDYYSIGVHNNNDLHYFYMINSELRIQSKANLVQNGINTPVEDYPNYWFRILKEGPGLFKIVPNGADFPLIRSGQKFIQASSEDPNDPIYFRILLFDIDWDIQAIDSKIMSPIMPPSTTNSAYNSTLRNCSSGTLTQTVGESTTITTTQSAGWEESMSVSTSNSGSISVTISHEAETKFFGTGGKTSGSITGSYEYTKTQTETNTRSGSLSTEKSVQVSVSRQIGVPPGTAIAVADVYQQYTNIKVPFVQRFRISGKYQENNNDLTGQEILTQFAFNSFTGVVTDVQANFIEVTVRGTTTIDRIIETTTETRDIKDACN